MMQEVSGDSVVPQSNITDQLQEAAQTNVTKALPGASDGAAVSATSTISSVLSPPSELPPNIATPPVSPPSAGTMYNPSPMSPPPPTGGFVPSPGAVSATPSRYPTSFGSPSSPHQQSSPGSAVSPMSSPYVPPPPPTQPFSPSMPPSQTSITPASQQPIPTYPGSPQTQYPASPHTPGQMQYSSPQASSPYVSQQSQAVPGMPSSPEATASIDLGGAAVGPVYPQPQEAGGNKAGLFGWFSGSTFMNKVVEKTKTLSENVITTLDPGMKEVIYSGGDVCVVVASTKEVKVGAVRQAFQEILGHATVYGQDSQPSSIAPQPVGYTAGLKGCEERIEGLRRISSGADNAVYIAVENFIVEILPDRWFDIGCIVLKDPVNNIDLQTFTQATPVASEYVQQAQDQTPTTYDLRWSGLAVTVGQVINQKMPYVNHADWHTYFTGVSRREMIYLGAKTLAGIYRQKLTNRIQ